MMKEMYFYIPSGLIRGWRQQNPSVPCCLWDQFFKLFEQMFCTFFFWSVDRCGGREELRPVCKIMSFRKQLVQQSLYLVFRPRRNHIFPL